MASTQSVLFPHLKPSEWSLVSSTLQDRIIGALVGSALGDAIGLYTEFLSKEVSRESYPSRKFVLYPIKDATPFRRDFHRGSHVLGDWTDDTDHAILILLSFLHSGGSKLDPLDFASRLRTWVEMGLRALDTLPLGLGRTVGTIVRKKAFLDHPTDIARDVWIQGQRNVAPNGSLMRTHPLGLMCLSKSLQATFEVAASYSIITHADPRCVLCCAVGTALVRSLVLGEVREEVHVDEIIDAGVAWYEGWAERNIERDKSFQADPPLDLDELKRYSEAKSLSELELDDKSSIGYVYKTFGSGILLLRLSLKQMKADNWDVKPQLLIFETMITDLVLQGGDADTNACFAGALMGSLLGYKSLPSQWREGLRHGKWLVEKAQAMCKLLGVQDGTYNGIEDTDTHLDGGRGFLTRDEIEKRWMLLQARMASDETEFRKDQESKETKETKRSLGQFFRDSVRRA